ncbi:hypothetical protein LCGC14_2931160, partial [marine sediment metagenome]
ELSNLAKKIITLKADIEKTKSELEQVLSFIKRKTKETNKQKQEKDPFVRMLDDAKRELGQIRKELAVYKRRLFYVEKEIEYSKFWTSGFREIRLFLISEFLTQFEIEANNCLRRLGMNDWTLSFEVESETKSKTIKKGFSIFVTSPYNSVPVSFDSWSGGETQRLILSGSIGLSNMILGRYGVSSNIEVWDEPSSWLSEEGIYDLLDTLKVHSRQEGKQVWVVDQRFLEYGDFDGMVTVVKEETGSYFEWDE